VSNLTIAVAAIYNNMGNLELAQGNTEEAAQYYDQAIEIWVNGGDETSTHLALTYLCVGRDWMLRGVLPEALKYTALSDDLLAQTVSGDKGFMAKYVLWSRIRTR
jgi:tetratricopeptide (TPR) repeat protein